MWRRLLAGVLVALAAVLAPAAVVAVWAKQTITDQDRYLELVSAVSSVPAVQDEVREQVVEAVVRQIDPGRLTAAVVERAVTRAVDRVLGAQRFGEFWLGINRVVHAQVTGVLAGDSDQFQLSEDGTLTMALGPVLDALTDQLAEFGVPVPPGLSTDASVVLVRSQGLATAQSVHDGVLLAAAWFPLVCAVSISVGVLLVRRRYEAVLVAGLVAAGVGLAIILALRAIQALLPVIARDVAGAVRASLEPWLWATVAVAVAVAVGAVIMRAVRRRAQHA